MKNIYAAVAFALFLTACSGTDDTDISTTNTTTCHDTLAGKVSIVDYWVREAPSGRPMSAAYLTICNQTDQPIVMVGANADIADATELHQTTRDRDGIASMSPLDRLEIAPGGSVSLEPGGAHIMLIGVKEPVLAGNLVDLTVQFEKAPPIAVQAEARATTPAQSHHGGH